MHDGFDKKSKLGVMEQAGLCGSMGLCFLAFSSVSFQVVIVYQLVQFFSFFSSFRFLSLFPFSLSLSLSLSISLSPFISAGLVVLGIWNFFVLFCFWFMGLFFRLSSGSGFSQVDFSLKYFQDLVVHHQRISY